MMVTMHPVWRASVRLGVPFVMQKGSYGMRNVGSDGWWYRYI